MRHRNERAVLRPEIQALRAIAVLAVVLYHLWPARVPGGYVGVDIFFAISGYLIIGHLLREVDATGSVRLASFWAKRARRLLPASLLVLVVTGVVTLAFVPAVWWQQFFQEIAASALYGLNWVLAYNAVDYLAADNAASPVQHFWSLSVEEQFYIVWPLIIVAILLVGRRHAGRARAAVGIALVVLTVLSFAYSCYGVATDPAGAYFVTTGRAWEFGLGGVLAFFGSRKLAPTVGALAAWAGLAAIAISLWSYTHDTPFPGVAALLPVGGTLLVIWAGSPERRWAPSAVFALRPVQFVGNVSYSFYLWHWPPIVLLPFVLGRELDTITRVVILVGALGLAWLTKVLVEDPARNGRALVARPAWVSLAVLLTATVVVAGGSSIAWARAQASIDQAAAVLKEAVDDELPCVGAPASDPASGCPTPFAVTELTNPAFAATDIGNGVQVVDKCKQTLEDSAVIACEVGDPTATPSIAIVGDSHAGHFLEALDRYGRVNGIGFVAYLKTWCTGTGADDVASVITATPAGTASCTEWGNGVIAEIVADPTITTVIYSNYTRAYAAHGAVGRPLAAGDYERAWASLVDAGKSVVALRDIPSAGMDVPACVAANMGRYDPCTTPEDAALLSAVDDPMMQAASATGAPVVDLTATFCTEGQCHSVIGGLVVYFGTHHMTATFSRTIAPIVGDAIIDAATP